MFTISNGELSTKPDLQEKVKCRYCIQLHNIQYGDIVNGDGSKEKSNLLAFIKCPKNNKCYLVGIKGKQI